MDGGTERHVEGIVEQNEDEPLIRAEWKSLFSFTSRTHVCTLIIGVFFSSAAGIIIPSMAFLLGKIFDSFTSFGSGNLDGPLLVKDVSTYGIYLVGLGVASWLLNGSFFMYWLMFGELQAKNARDKLFNGMLHKEMGWYEMRKSGIGAMVPRLQTQIRELQIATSQPMGFALQYTVTMFAAIGLAFYTAWNVTLVTLATVPLVAIFLAWISARMQPAIDNQRENLTQASKLANNAISAIDTVKCFNGQEFELLHYVDVVRRAGVCYLTQARANALQIGFVRFSLLCMFVQGFWFGSHLVNTGSRTSGQILTAFWACLLATQTVEQVLPQMIVLEKGKSAGATLKAILLKIEGGRKISTMIGGIKPTYCEGAIRIKDVSFAYPSRPEHLVLNNASFVFPEGETTFVIGKSGSGKSTIGNLLLQFYRPDSGEILIDGKPLKVIDTSWLRNNISLVQQQSVLFNETIFNNIAFGRKDHTNVRREDVERCVEAAALTDTVAGFPDGLDTVMGTGVSMMSGGQKQRVAIARAYLRDTPILILDEATSALDHITRSLVMDAIRDWRHGKTTIIITHDVSQIQEDDYAYVLNNGKIVQEGLRSVLGQSKIGPFASILPIGTGKPIAAHQTLGLSRKQSQRLGSSQASPRVSLLSQDPMDIHTARGETIFPRAYYPGLEQDRSKRLSQISALFPVSVNINQMSNARISTQSYRDPILSFEKPLPPLPDEVEMEDLNWKPSTSDEASPTNPIRRTSHHSLMNLTATSKPHRLKFLRLAKRNRTMTEGARDLSSLTSILGTVWPRMETGQRAILFLGFFFALIHAAATPVFSWALAKLLATFSLTAGQSSMAATWSLVVLAVAFGDGIACYCFHYLLEASGQAWVDSIRVDAMKCILDQPRSWFDEKTNGLSTLNESLDRNAEEMRNLVGRFAGFIFVAVSMMSISVIWSFLICWKLTLVGLATGPILYGITRGFETVSGIWEQKTTNTGGIAGGIFSETFVNIGVVRALTLEGYFHKKHAKATADTLKIGVKRALWCGILFGLADASIMWVTALIFYYGCILVSSSQYSSSDMLTVFTMLLFSIANVNNIVTYIPQISSSGETAARLLSLCNLPYQTSHEYKGTIQLQKPLSSIRITNLTFAYPNRPSQPVLSCFNLTLLPNTLTALVGSSGCGKSTVATLLLGLYPPSASIHHTPITINGIGIQNLNIPIWRSLISLVPQSPVLFATTIGTNITYGLPENSPLASLANIRHVASLAGIDAFILSLPRGYDTLIGEGGLGLSGGQVQRLGIARALVRRPAMVIMDEPTSALDAESAQVVRKSITGLVAKGGITVLVITHSWEMMRACERCVVMGQGRVLEEGRVEELMKKRDGELSRLLGRGEGLT